MGLFDNFPYTNFHELNLDWILKKIKELSEQWDRFKIDVVPTIKEEVDDWLNAHPEATTTVMDGAITEAKIYPPFLEVSRVWVNVASMVEDYNLTSANIAQAITDALDISNYLYIPSGEYTFTMNITKDCTIIMADDCIIRTDNDYICNGNPIFTATGCSFNLYGGQILVGENNGSRIALTYGKHGAIFLDNCHDCVISHITSYYSKTNSVIWCKDSTNVTVEHCYFDNILRAAMFIADSCKNIIVRNNTFKNATYIDNQSWCYFVYTGVSSDNNEAVPVDGLIYENNYCENSEDCGLDTHGAKNVIIRNNTVLNTVCAITAYNDNLRQKRPAGWTMDNILIENNYCESEKINSAQQISLGYPHPFLFIGATNVQRQTPHPENPGSYDAFKNCIIRNNVFITKNDYSGGAIYLDNISKNVEFNNNYFKFLSGSQPFITFRRSMFFKFVNNKTESWDKNPSHRCALVYNHCYGEIDKNKGFRHSTSSSYIAHVKGLLPEYDNVSDPTVETGETIFINNKTHIATSYGLRRRDANAFINVPASFTFTVSGGVAHMTSPDEVPFIPNLSLEVTDTGNNVSNAWVNDLIDMENFTIVMSDASALPDDNYTATVRIATLTEIA